VRSDSERTKFNVLEDKDQSSLEKRYQKSIRNCLWELSSCDSLSIPDAHISGIAWDSRKVQPGDVFFALVGGNVDGHQFIDGAVERGAAAVIGNATYMTWDPEANEGLGGYVNTGGNRFSVYAEVRNQPGTGIDRFWIRAVDKLVMDKPAQTNAVTIGSGNIVAHH
jgi:hypothetical protein